MTLLPSPPTRSRVQSSDVLLAKLAAVLPKGYAFGIYHISTPPTRTEALFHAPPGRRTDRTFLERHFLAVTIGAQTGASDKAEPSGPPVIVFALEIFIFTTAFSSTFFVSKADSSGYLHLLQLPRGTPSPIREVSAAFVAYLVEQRRRTGVQSVVSLFARAQSQYLFPGSVDNAGKHVLDDRGLVKWWCRVLDPLLAAEARQGGADIQAPWKSVGGYLVVPGLDQYETRAFLPRARGGQPQPHWTLGHPLERISHYVRELEGSKINSKSSATAPTAAVPAVPPRCLIPRYPDDPKARYLDELDDEAERAGQKDAGAVPTSSAHFGSGRWTSVKTLDQFWDMMAFRQECSSGRLTGFIWVVFEAAVAESCPRTESEASAGKTETKGKTQTKRPKRPKTRLKGYIVPRIPRAKKQQHEYLLRRPESTPYYYWPAEGRGTLLVDEADYKRINELLLQLDFSTLEKGIISTRRWIKEAGVGSEWRLDVMGMREASMAGATGAKEDGSVAATNRVVVANDLSGLVKRKRAAASAGIQVGGGEATDPRAAPRVNVLSTGLVRKKPKVE